VDIGIKDVKTWLGDDADLFKYSVGGDSEGDYVILRFKEYVGKQTFSRAAKIIREHGGEYISNGKNSHFRFPISINVVGEARSGVKTAAGLLVFQQKQEVISLLRKAIELLEKGE